MSSSELLESTLALRTQSPGRLITLKAFTNEVSSLPFLPLSPINTLLGVQLGFVIGWGNINGIVASNIYRAGDAPRFKPGHGTVLGYEAAFLLGGSVLQHVLLKRENAKRRRGERDHWIEGKTAEEIDKMGDRRPDFMYTL